MQPDLWCFYYPNHQLLLRMFPFPYITVYFIVNHSIMLVFISAVHINVLLSLLYSCGSWNLNFGFLQFQMLPKKLKYTSGLSVQVFSAFLNTLLSMRLNSYTWQQTASELENNIVIQEWNSTLSTCFSTFHKKCHKSQENASTSRNQQVYCENKSTQTHFNKAAEVFFLGWKKKRVRANNLTVASIEAPSGNEQSLDLYWTQTLCHKDTRKQKCRLRY